MQSRILIVVAAIAVGVLAAISAGRYLNSARETIADDSKPVEVLVAQEGVPIGATAEEMLNKKLVATEKIPSKYVAEGAISNMKTVENRVLAVSLSPGEQLTEARFQFPSEAGLSFTVPDNSLAVSIAVDEVKGVAGLLKPGDSVSILATFAPGPEDKDITRIILPKAKVLAVGTRVGAERETDSADDGAQPVLGTRSQEREQGGATVTLALVPKDVEKLVFAEETGEVWLALLPATATSVPQTTGHTLETVLK